MTKDFSTKQFFVGISLIVKLLFVLLGVFGGVLLQTRLTCAKMPQEHGQAQNGPSISKQGTATNIKHLLKLLKMMLHKNGG